MGKAIHSSGESFRLERTARQFARVPFLVVRGRPAESLKTTKTLVGRYAVVKLVGSGEAEVGAYGSG